MFREAPKKNITDEATWNRAKEQAKKSYKESDDFFWAAVTDIYKKMGGGFKHKSASIVVEEMIRKSISR